MNENKITNYEKEKVAKQEFTINRVNSSSNLSDEDFSTERHHGIYEVYSSETYSFSRMGSDVNDYII